MKYPSTTHKTQRPHEIVWYQYLILNMLLLVALVESWMFFVVNGNDFILDEQDLVLTFRTKWIEEYFQKQIQIA